MNLTISVDAKLLERARALARRRGMSLQDMLRAYLESLVGDRSADDVADELMELLRTEGGHSGGARIERDDAYRDRV